MDVKTAYCLRAVALWVLIFCGYNSFAQTEQWGEGGEIESVEIEIVKERQITLPSASRNFEKIPPRPAEPIMPPMTYDFKNFRFSTPDFQPIIKPLRLKQEELTKISNGYLSAGFGNFASPFLSASFSSKRNANKFYGADFLHRSFGSGPVGDKNSASGNTSVGLFTSGFNNLIAANLKVSYENRVNHFYGYRPLSKEVKRDTIRQVYNTVTIGGSIENVKPADFNYQLRGNFSYLTDYYNAVESDASIAFGSKYKFSETSLLNFQLDYRLLARKDSLVEAKPRSLLKVGSAYQFQPLEKMKIHAGLLAVFENDTIGANKSLHLYPDVQASYALASGINAFAGIGGNMEQVSLHTLSRENPWVNANINLFHSNKTFDLTLGIDGKVGSYFVFKAGFAASTYQHLYFFRNNAARGEKFDVVYDNATIANPFGEWGFQKGDKVKMTMRGDYFAYSMDKEAEAWHRPEYRLGFYTTFNIVNKLAIGANLISLGGMKALDTANRVVSLETAVDLQIRATYLVSKNFSCYLEGNNLLNSDYPLFYNYPVRGLQVSGGIGWSF